MFCLKPAVAQQGTHCFAGLQPKHRVVSPGVQALPVARKIAETDLTNSASVSGLIRDGKLQISLSAAEDPLSGKTISISCRPTTARAMPKRIMLRVKGGGAPRGGAGVPIPSGLFAGAIGAGVGGAGGLGGFGSAGGITGGARQVFGFARGSYDPHAGYWIQHRSNHQSPEFDRRVGPARSRNELDGTADTLFSGIHVRLQPQRLFQQHAPEIDPALSSLQSLFCFPALNQPHPAIAERLWHDIGRRFVEVAKNESKIMKEIVRLQVNTTLAQAQNTYWDLVAARENVRVAEQSLAVAQRLHADNKSREEIGTASGLDVVTAESEVAARQRDLVAAQTTLQMREVDLKNVISKNLSGPGRLRADRADRCAAGSESGRHPETGGCPDHRAKEQIGNPPGGGQLADAGYSDQV